MTDNIISRNNYTSFGGEITIEDFNTYIPSKKRINNQVVVINSKDRKTWFRKNE